MENFEERDFILPLSMLKFKSCGAHARQIEIRVKDTGVFMQTSGFCAVWSPERLRFSVRSGSSQLIHPWWRTVKRLKLFILPHCYAGQLHSIFLTFFCSISLYVARKDGILTWTLSSVFRLKQNYVLCVFCSTSGEFSQQEIIVLGMFAELCFFLSTHCVL